MREHFYVKEREGGRGRGMTRGRTIQVGGKVIWGKERR
jgi:hypothetical protein